jgi:hypothetical protein
MSRLNINKCLSYQTAGNSNFSHTRISFERPILGWLKNEVYKVQVNIREALIRRTLLETLQPERHKTIRKQQAPFTDEAENV